MLEILGKKYLTPKEAAQKIGLSVSWLEKRRHLKKPPSFIKFQGKVLYEIETLTNWFKEQLKEEDV